METRKSFAFGNRQGFSLVETLIYIFLVTILSVVVVNSIVFMSKSFYTLRNEKNIALSASTFLNRLSYETRQASAYSLVGSTLTLTGGESSMVFATSSTNQILLNGSSLSIPDVTVEKLLFKQLKTSNSQGLSVELVLSAGNGSNARTQNFQLTTMLRNN